MPRRQFKGLRNRLDLNDRVQARIVRKRLKVSNQELCSLVETVGNSIAAVTKEAHSRKALASTAGIPSAAAIASVHNAGAIAEEAELLTAQPGPA